MLVIKVEIWPGGDASRAKEIGRAGVANVTHLAEDSDYLVVASSDLGESEAMVLDHNRADGFWKLASEVCRAAATPKAKLTSSKGLAKVPKELTHGVPIVRDSMFKDGEC